MELNLIITTAVFAAFFTSLFTILGQILIEESKKYERKKYFLYEKLYIPYIKLYMKSHKGVALYFTDLKSEEQDEVINLLTDNVIYIKDKKLSEDMYSFYTEYYSMINNHNKQYYENINNLFYKVTDYIFNKVDNLPKDIIYKVDKIR